MSSFARSPITAVLGPTNTGKTHLAVERMCAHSSGLMGFPLRLLAREIYDRVVRIKGAENVALLTGEEKIAPPHARYWLSTVESMPVLSGRPGLSGGPAERDYAFVGIDEIQLAADPERGHVFTDRLLRARGREETMFLGSATAAPLVRHLVPDAEIISRPRFSTLSYAGTKKLSRLPKRSAIVAFSSEEVYAVAETLRRMRGGAAVVMGALSPGTRNAQVDMFMNGDVDYLVATDAIGMGLNLDVAHVAFASLTKFDGRRLRRLHTTEIAQISGRAGRHHRDGTFGTVGNEGSPNSLTPEEIEAIESHRFQPQQSFFWRQGEPDFSSVPDLIASLEEWPDDPMLRAAPEASDLAALKRLADDPAIAALRGERRVARLWAACGIPDFQKLGPDHHARIVTRIWRFLSEGDGHVPRDWLAQHITRLDNVQGDVDTISGRISAARTWAYIAHRPDWLRDPAEMAERTRQLETRLSDALHAALRQRFVDRRTSLLLREVGMGAELPVEIAADGTVSVDGEMIGRLDGFHFRVDPRARGSDRKLLLAAAERRLGKILLDRTEELIAAQDDAFALATDQDGAPVISWNGETVAALGAGTGFTAPALKLDRALAGIDQQVQKNVLDRLNGWMKAQFEKHLTPLMKMQESAADAETPAVVRAVFAQLADMGGIAARTALDDALTHVDKEQRSWLRKAGLTIGVLDIFHPGLLKPGAAQWRLALIAARGGKPVLPTPPAGAVVLKCESREDQIGAQFAGFRGFGDQQVRIDMAERMARAAHEAIAKGEAFTAQSPQIVSLGLVEANFPALMRAAGFRPVDNAEEGKPNWAFRGRNKNRKPQRPAPSEPRGQKREPGKGPKKGAPREQQPKAQSAAPATSNAFAGLAELMARGR